MVNRQGMPNFLQLAVFAREFDDVIPFTHPPRVVQRLLFDLLTSLARLLGYRGSYPGIPGPSPVRLRPRRADGCRSRPRGI
jgi:hypothetical protein